MFMVNETDAKLMPVKAQCAEVLHSTKYGKNILLTDQCQYHHDKLPKS